MRPGDIARRKTTNPELERLQQGVSAYTEQVSGCDLINGSLLSDIYLGADEIKVAHKLGKIPTGYVVVDLVSDESVDHDYWDFTGGSSGDALRLPTSDPKWVDFDPQQNSNDFTVAGVFKPDGVSSTGGLLSKDNTKPLQNDRSWLTSQQSNLVTCIVSSDGTVGNRTVLSLGGLSAGAEAFYAFRYKYVSAGTNNRMDVDVNGVNTNVTNAVGPVYSTVNADVQIADYDTTVDRFFDGKIYWLAYWNRRLSDEEVHLLYKKCIFPDDGFVIGDTTMYITFSKSVGITYDTEIPTTSDYSFDIEGSPSAGTGSETIGEGDVIKKIEWDDKYLTIRACCRCTVSLWVY